MHKGQGDLASGLIFPQKWLRCPASTPGRPSRFPEARGLNEAGPGTAPPTHLHLNFGRNS